MTETTKIIKRRLKNYDEYNVNPKKFLALNNPLHIYILGLIWSDGHVNTKGRNELIIFTQSYPDAAHFKPIFMKTGNWKIYEIQEKQFARKVDIKTNNHYICQFLVENDFKQKSLVSPDKILSLIPEELQHYFYLGVLDGDGYWYLNHKNHCFQFNMTSSYDQDWNYMVKLCDKLGMKYRIERRNVTYKGQPRGRCSKFRLTSKIPFIKFREYLYSTNLAKRLGLKRKVDSAYSLEKCPN